MSEYGEEEEFCYQETGELEEECFYAEDSTDDIGVPKIIPKPESLSKEECLEKMHGDVAEVAEALGTKSEKAFLLLRHFKWNKSKAKESFFMDDPVRCAQMAGVSLETDDATLVFGEGSDDEIECQMCWDDVPANKAAHLAACNHWFCMSCWYSNLKFRVDSEGSKSVGAPCLTKGCEMKCSPAVYRTVFPEGDPLRIRYEKFLLEDWMMTLMENYGYCPAPACEFVTFSPLGKLRKEPCQHIKCKCGHDYCFLCDEEAHAPCDCDLLKKWKAKEVDDGGNATWITANTRPCPRCKTNCEKNGGCNYVQCRCGLGFCFHCGEDHHNGTDTCNRYKPDKEAEAFRDKARNELNRYSHYFTRYKNHDASRKLDATVMKNVRKRIERELTATRRSLNEMDYLHETVATLIGCRLMLKWTYVYAYYLKDESTEKDLFEHNQGELEKATELLSEFIEDRTGKFSSQEVVNKTSVAKQMLKNMESSKK